MISQLPDDAFFKTAKFFIAGVFVTAVFSGLLARLTPNADLEEVLAIGLIVPSFTWVVQLFVSSKLLPTDNRRKYHAALSRVCLLGSIALLPAAVINLCLAQPPFWISAANVLASVVIMAIDLFRRSAAQNISRWWPVSWCGTIACNIAIFVWVSRDWWTLPTTAR